VTNEHVAKVADMCRREGASLPSSKPFATPEKLQTAVQEKSHQLKISGGQALMASTVAIACGWDNK
jgi:hypothetical protein